MKNLGSQLKQIQRVAREWLKFSHLKLRFYSITGLFILSLWVLSFQNCSKGFEVQMMGDDSFASLEFNQSRAIEVLSSNCSSCHGSSELGGVSHITDVQSLIDKGLVAPGEPENSKLFQVVMSNTMPPTYAMSSQDKAILSDWIFSLGHKSPGGEIIPSDLSFPMTLSVEPQLFRLRLSKVQAVLGSASSASLNKLIENRYLLGDYDFSKGVTPKYSFEVSDMQIWLQSIEPVCKSTEITSRFRWPTGAAGFVQLALARDLNAADNAVLQTLQSQSMTDAEKFEVFCLAVLSSLEFIAK